MCLLSLLRLTHVMEALKLVAVAFSCPWREQGEIVPPESYRDPGSPGLALGGVHFSPLTAAKASACFIQKEAK